MIENYEIYRGGIIRLSDEPIQDFIFSVGLERGMYKPGVDSPEGLAEHAEQLSLHKSEIESAYSRDNINHSNELWESIFKLEYQAEGNLAGIADCYTYSRIEQFLRAEFGPAESKTTNVIRGIARAVVQTKAKSLSAPETATYLNGEMCRDVLDKIYPFDGNSTGLSRCLEDYIFGIDKPSDISDTDTALARVVSTLGYVGSSVVTSIPHSVRVKSLESLPLKSSSVGSQSPGIASKEATDETSTITDLELPSLGQAVSFDKSRGNCRVDKLSGMTEEEYDELRRYMMTIMFPGRGEDLDMPRSICKGCPIRDECLEFALVNNIQNGIWGGESERSRRKMRKARNMR